VYDELNAIEITSDDVIYVHANIYKTIFGYESNIFMITSRTLVASVLVTEMEGFLSYAVEISSACMKTY
jgi:hypothetical protein